MALHKKGDKPLPDPMLTQFTLPFGFQMSVTYIYKTWNSLSLGLWMVSCYFTGRHSVDYGHESLIYFRRLENSVKMADEISSFITAIWRLSFPMWLQLWALPMISLHSRQHMIFVLHHAYVKIMYIICVFSSILKITYLSYEGSSFGNHLSSSSRVVTSITI